MQNHIRTDSTLRISFENQFYGLVGILKELKMSLAIHALFYEVYIPNFAEFPTQCMGRSIIFL